MRSSLLLITTAALFAACQPSGPQEGDVYEDPMSRERERVVQRGPCRYAYHYLIGYGIVPTGEPDTVGERFEREFGIRRPRGIAHFTVADTAGHDCVATISERNGLGLKEGHLNTPAEFAARRLVKVN